MLFKENDLLRFFHFDIFPTSKVVHGIFTRHGGVSPSPWNTLNVGGNNGDQTENVIENRSRLFRAVNREVMSLFDVWQVHSTDVIYTDQPRPLNSAHVRADAIITDHPEITLFMRFGDCVPILLFDPIRNAVGLAHAGWIGTAEKMGTMVVKSMVEKFGSNPKDLLAGIGPSIGPDHYEVGEDVISRFKKSFGADSDAFFSSSKDSVHLNLWEANRYCLEKAGVRQIEIAGVCTACNETDWFSHRKEKGKTGRFGAVISLN
jgi:polyphenol oxidase